MRRTLAVLLVCGCHQIIGPPPSEERSSSVGGGQLRIVALEIDEATQAWAGERPSAFDGQPIGESGKSRRFREVLALVQSELTLAGAAMVVYSASFPSSEDTTYTEALAMAMAAFPGPVLATHLPDAASDPRLRSSRRGGHALLAGELLVNQLGQDEFDIRIGRYGTPTIHQGLLPLAQEAYAALTDALEGDGDARAARAADCLQATFVTHFDTGTGVSSVMDVIPISKTPFAGTLSARDLVEEGGAAYTSLLGGAAVLVIDTHAAVEPRPLFGDGEAMVPMSFAHPLLLAALEQADSPDGCPSSPQSASDTSSSQDLVGSDQLPDCASTCVADGDCGCEACSSCDFCGGDDLCD
jgi:hypothetical protein